MKVLITGGLGYVGGRLATFLKKNNDVDIFLSTRDCENIPLWAKDFSVKSMDLNPSTIQQCLSDVRPDIIIHLAAMNQQQCEKNHELAYQVNVVGTQNLVEASVQMGVKKFLYFSTAQVYGNLSGELTETHICNPLNVYGQTKKQAEECVQKYDGKNGLNTLVLRLANGYGYPMDAGVNVWNLVFNAFCKQCFLDHKIIMRSNQYRNFISLVDITRGVSFFLEEKNSRYFKGIYNVGGVSCLTILDVAKKIVNVYQKNIDQVNIPIECPEDESQVKQNIFQYNVEKLKSTGFEWMGCMDDEILKTFESVRVGFISA